MSELKGKTLTGWKEIRQALVILDRIPEEERNGARIEVHEYGQGFSVEASFTSLKMLDDWLNLRFRKQLLKGDTRSTSRKLDVLS